MTLLIILITFSGLQGHQLVKRKVETLLELLSIPLLRAIAKAKKKEVEGEARC